MHKWFRYSNDLSNLMTCFRLSGSSSASLLSTSSSSFPALYIVSLARIILMATSGFAPSAPCLSLSYAVTTLENMPFPLAFTTSYLQVRGEIVATRAGCRQSSCGCEGRPAQIDDRCARHEPQQIAERAAHSPTVSAVWQQQQRKALVMLLSPAFLVELLCCTKQSVRSRTNKPHLPPITSPTRKL
jgi:hypothetical protein